LKKHLERLKPFITHDVVAHVRMAARECDVQHARLCSTSPGAPLCVRLSPAPFMQGCFGASSQRGEGAFIFVHLSLVCCMRGCSPRGEGPCAPIVESKVALDEVARHCLLAVLVCVCVCVNVCVSHDECHECAAQ